MKIIILGGAGFIGTNLAIQLNKVTENEITLVDEKLEYFDDILKKSDMKILISSFDQNTEFDNIISGQDVVYHLISTNNPTSSNKNVGSEIATNIIITINLLEACVRNKVKKIIFISSGGTVYGKTDGQPVKETANTKPITTYGIQKLTIEKILYLYNYMHQLDYVIFRLANPYGPYQRPNGKLGVISTFVNKAIHDEEVVVYGDGNVIRDYIYIDDAVRCIILLSNMVLSEHVFNLGSGIGYSVNDIIERIERVLDKKLAVRYIEQRAVDVPINILDISKIKRYLLDFKLVDIDSGIARTYDYLNTKG